MLLQKENVLQHCFLETTYSTRAKIVIARDIFRELQSGRGRGGDVVLEEQRDLRDGDL